MYIPFVYNALVHISFTFNNSNFTIIKELTAIFVLSLKLFYNGNCCIKKSKKLSGVCILSDDRTIIDSSQIKHRISLELKPSKLHLLTRRL